MHEEISVVAQVSILVLQIGVIIFAARFCGKAAQRFHIPSVLGELLAGIIIGPYLLGGVGFGSGLFANGLFPLPATGNLPVSTPLYAIATLGSIILLFMSGLETDLRLLFRYSVAGTIVGIGGVIFSFGFGAGLGMIMLDAGFMDPRCLFLGILSTATSVGITARILSDKKSMDSPEGTTIMAAAVIDDVLGIICLAVVLGIVGVSDAASGGAVNWAQIRGIAVKSVVIWLGVTALGLAAAHHIARFLKLFRPSAVYAILAFGLALLLAGLFEQAGLAMIVGAYVMGLCLSKTDISFALQRSLRGIYDFLVPIFFVVMGMLVDVRVLGDMDVLTFGLLYSALAIISKIIGCALPALFLNFNLLGALRIGAGMIPRGEVALIIAGIGATTTMMVNGEPVPIINPKLFGVAIIMTLVTTIVAPPLLSLLLGIPGKGVKKEVTDSTLVFTYFSLPSEVVRDFVLRTLIENLRLEGFRHSEFSRDENIIYFRKEDVTFTLQIKDNDFEFESTNENVRLIRMAMYETLVELHKNLEELKSMACPVGMSEDIIKNSEAPKQRVPLDLDKIISPECVVNDLKATNHEDAIRELIQVLARSGRLLDIELCQRDVLAREAVVHTCIAGGIALPHARTNGVSELVTAIGISRDGCDSPAGDGSKTKIFVLSLCPKFAEGPYLQLVAHVAAVLGNEENIQALSASPEVEDIRRVFLRKLKKG
ncbi:MAG: cation:proton antiporter [Lentisphaeria bacterium]|jgi:Kef-type K+ transport system membrane component KefB/mannitol/fructose-specific phosphotransferase system IIA component (Ntr-type)